MLPGGVCAHLDYEIEDMTEYVAEMAQRLVFPGSPVTAPFRKFVSGLLSSTRLPHTTILLGMNYLARRINMLKSASAGTIKMSDGQVWRLLTIGLLLGSKFLDDNTFQNKSWSEVSGIPVSELNSLEHDWLEDLNWNLYVNLDESADYQAWLTNWKDWSAAKKKERTIARDRLSAAPLAPIDTNVPRVRPYAQPYSAYTKSASRERQQYVPYDHSAWVNSYPTPHLTPPSASDSGVTTPEYMSATSGPQYDWSLFNQYAARHYQQPHGGYMHPRIASYQTPFSHHYGNPYNNSIWGDPSVADCNCSACGPQPKQSYFMGHHPYGGSQAVVG
jgi:hypothetical protein